MAIRPPAEFDVTPDLIRRLLGAQHPDLGHLPVRIVANGWDNTIARLGDELAVRMPRREVAAALARHEQQWLPLLGPRLGVDVPVPVRTGLPSPDFPWTWSVVPWFRGRPAADLPAAARAGLARPLAEVVARLHVPAPPDAPHNPVRGGPLAGRDRPVRERLAAGAVPQPREVLVLWDRLRDTAPWGGPPMWLHGDLHPRNLVVAHDGGLRAVLDFGDLTSGDPATDLSAAWAVFGPRDRRAFQEHVTLHCGTDAATWQRARGWALNLAVALLAHADDDPTGAAMGRFTLDAVLAG